MRPSAATPTRSAELRAQLGDAHAAGDLAVALPVGQLVRDLRVVRGRLDAPTRVEGPRGDGVLPEARLPQSSFQRRHANPPPGSSSTIDAGSHDPPSIRTSTRPTGAPQATPSTRYWAPRTTRAGADLSRARPTEVKRVTFRPSCCTLR
jgi:hypothetical protein